MRHALVTLAGAYTGQTISRLAVGETLEHALHTVTRHAHQELGEPVEVRSVSTIRSILHDLWHRQEPVVEELRGVH